MSRYCARADCRRDIPDPHDGRPTIIDYGDIEFTVQVYANVRPRMENGRAVLDVSVGGGGIDFDFLVSARDYAGTYHADEGSPPMALDADELPGMPVRWRIDGVREADKAMIALLAERSGAGLDLRPWPDGGGVLVCGDCGCLFTPMDDREHLYPDRYKCVGIDPVSHDHDAAFCACHDLPYSIPDNEENP